MRIIRRSGPTALLAFLLVVTAGRAEAQDGTGRIAGRVVDGASTRPLTGVQVVLEGTARSTISDLDGRFRFSSVPAGRHRLKFALLGHATKIVDSVTVRADETTLQDVTLDMAAIEVEAITVTAAAERGNTAQLLEERRQSSVVEDAIGAAQISSSPDGDAAKALSRVPGMTVVDNKYVYVRGLGDRYSNTLLNGSVMPSAESDRKAASLDIIPSELVERIVTAKTYSADKPGDYAGGLVQIETMQFPTSRTLKFSVGGAVNSSATGEGGLSYSGGDLDFFGFDDGTRDLPGILPEGTSVSRTNFSPDDLREIGLGFTGTDWGPTTSTLPADASFGFTYGDAFDLGSRRLGVLASITHAVGRSFSDDQVERVFATAGLADPEVDFVGNVSSRDVTSGGLLDLTYLLTPTNKIRGSAIYNRVVDDESRILQGFNLDSNTDQRNTRLRYIERTTFSGSLRGEHLLSSLGRTRLEWTAAYTATGRYEPNTREVLYRRAPDGTFLFDTFIQSGSVFHQDLDDTGFSGSIDIDIPVNVLAGDGTFSFGAAANDRNREVFSRRLRFLPAPGAVIGDEIRSRNPNELFTPETVGPDGFQIQEATFRTDNYDGEYRVLAAYAMSDVQITQRLKAEIGARVEQADQVVNPRDLFPTPLPPVEGAKLDDTDLLPAINLTWLAGEDMNVRLGASQTVARPQLRELAPFSFADFAGGYLAVGNPELVRTKIQNFDVRWEWFFAPGAVVSVSGFYKNFDDPIETAVFPSSELIRSWVNVGEAENFGTEIEFRSGLGFLSGSLSDLSLNANLTLVESDVTAGGDVVVFVPGQGPANLVVREENRPLEGQSPYVANVSVVWAKDAWGLKTSALFNSFGRRIASIGAELLENVYEESRSSLDLVVEKSVGRSLSAKFAAARLVGDGRATFTQFGDELRSYDLGRKFSLSLSWTPSGGF